MSSLTVSNEEFNQLRSLIEKECGIVIDDSKVYLIQSRLTNLVVESGSNSFGEFYRKASASTEPKLREKIVDAITTNETLWFRDHLPYEALRHQVLPSLLLQRQPNITQPFRIWSAAASTGQEPYSIAMMAQELAADKRYRNIFRPEHLHILGTDICSSALMLARLGRYDQLAMTRGMLPGMAEKYFTQNGNVSVINDDIKRMVKLEKFNVMDSFASKGEFDVIFLRYIAIYFSDDFKRELLKKVANALRPGGYLFLGSSEFFRNFQDDFELCQYERCSYYRRKG